MSASMTTTPIEIDRATGAALAARRCALQQPIWRLAVLTQIAPHTISRIEKGRRRISPAELAALDAALSSLERVLTPSVSVLSAQSPAHAPRKATGD